MKSKEGQLPHYIHACMYAYRCTYIHTYIHTYTKRYYITQYHQVILHMYPGGKGRERGGGEVSRETKNQKNSVGSQVFLQDKQIHPLQIKVRLLHSLYKQAEITRTRNKREMRGWRERRRRKTVSLISSPSHDEPAYMQLRAFKRKA